VFPNVSNRLAYQTQLFIPIGLGKYLRRSAGTFDVAHLHACRNLPGAIAARHLRKAGVPYVLAPNGTALRLERRLLAKRVFDVAVGTRLVRGAARVIAVSDAERRQLRRLGVDGDAVRLVPNPIDLDEFTPPPNRGGLRCRGIPPGAPIVLFLGQLTPRKRIDVLIRAFARLRRPDSWLVIAGNDMGSEARARALVSGMGLAERTCFTGLLRGRERLEALADADVVVYPSEHEIFGLVPLEALLSGTPVIVSDDSGCAEVVRGTGGGQLTPPGEVEALAIAIERVLDAPTAWRQMAADAAVRIRAAYGRDEVCARLDDLYREVVAAS
jgi:glycosyltransferase involved in cell wall biosynthesis